MQVVKAISIVAPNGSKIINGEKSIEVRSWKPSIERGEDLYIVENQNYLSSEFPQEEGVLIGIVKIKKVREFLKSDIEKACASYWAPGYFSWELYDIRSVPPKSTLAKLGIYEIGPSDE